MERGGGGYGGATLEPTEQELAAMEAELAAQEAVPSPGLGGGSYAPPPAAVPPPAPAPASEQYGGPVAEPVMQGYSNPDYVTTSYPSSGAPVIDLRSISTGATAQANLPYSDTSMYYQPVPEPDPYTPAHPSINTGAGGGVGNIGRRSPEDVLAFRDQYDTNRVASDGGSVGDALGRLASNVVNTDPAANRQGLGNAADAVGRAVGLVPEQGDMYGQAVAGLYDWAGDRAGSGARTFLTGGENLIRGLPTLATLLGDQAGQALDMYTGGPDVGSIAYGAKRLLADPFLKGGVWGAVEDVIGPHGALPRQIQSTFDDPGAWLAANVRDPLGAIKDQIAENPTQWWQAGPGAFLDGQYQTAAAKRDAGKGMTSQVEVAQMAAEDARDLYNTLPVDAAGSVLSEMQTAGLASLPDLNAAMQRGRGAALRSRMDGQDTTGMVRDVATALGIPTPDAAAVLGLVRDAADSVPTPYDPLSSAYLPGERPMPESPQGGVPDIRLLAGDRSMDALERNRGSAQIASPGRSQTRYDPLSSATLPREIPMPDAPANGRPPIERLSGDRSYDAIERQRMSAPAIASPLPTYDPLSSASIPREPGLLDRARAVIGSSIAAARGLDMPQIDPGAVTTPDLDLDLPMPQVNLSGLGIDLSGVGNAARGIPALLGDAASAAVGQLGDLGDLGEALGRGPSSDREQEMAAVFDPAPAPSPAPGTDVMDAVFRAVERAGNRGRPAGTSGTASTPAAGETTIPRNVDGTLIDVVWEGETPVALIDPETGERIALTPEMTQEQVDAIFADVLARSAGPVTPGGTTSRTPAPATTAPVSAPATTTSGASGASGGGSSRGTASGGRSRERGDSEPATASGFDFDALFAELGRERDSASDREFRAEDFLDAADGDRTRAAAMAKAANRKRKKRKDRTGKDTGRGRFPEGFPFNRPPSPIRQNVLAALAESMASPKGRTP